MKTDRLAGNVLRKISALLDVGKKVNEGLNQVADAVSAAILVVSALNTRLQHLAAGEISQEDSEFLTAEITKVEQLLNSIVPQVDLNAVANFSAVTTMRGYLQLWSGSLTREVISELKRNLRLLFEKVYETPGAGQLIGAVGMLVDIPNQIEERLKLLKNRTTCEKVLLVIAILGAIIVGAMVFSYFSEKKMCFSAKKN